MKLNKLFLKEIDRPIEGVIKADDEAALKLELEEYVITNEVEKRLESFLDAYNDYQGANGVWISGFFGSGKSHLLKMLALIIEGRTIDGTSALELFLPKCKDNALLKGALEKATQIPSKSILFNIDQKADVISKTQQDALLAVFVKVFDEMCGYYGKQGYIAQFERELDERGKYDAFKAAYKEVARKEWAFGREQVLLESQNVANAYAKVMDETPDIAKGILDKYRSDYKVSIEDFAEKIRTFVEARGKNFRLNFFVDEVGQYIADNTKLMTNLQTIAESLMTKCRGRAWIIVTAQEDMQNVIGEMNKQQSNDFSKIQARFNNRMKLTSANVDEVIQKRLLAKKEEGAEQLTPIYDKEVNNFKTLFDFADGATTYRNFQDEEHFVACYPFIPFQFALFQACIQALSEHNAFEGRHSSVGERSMLGVFQEVAKQISEHEVGQLATFDFMFEGIRTALKAQNQRAIIVAEKHLDEPFAIKILKALFLVKYVKGFYATVRNLRVLMVDNFNVDTPALQKKIETALNLLEQQTYIQRNGEKYEYLTNEEKDIESEIKNTEVENSDVADELAKMVFDKSIGHKKIRYPETEQDIPFSRKLDDRLNGRENELSINVISPFHENADNFELLKMHAMGKGELLLIMPQDTRLVTDLLMYKRTDKYIRQNITVTQEETKKRILGDKQHSNSQRQAQIQKKVDQLLSKAKLIVSGAEVEIAGTDPQHRAVQGFFALVQASYPNLKMLKGYRFREEDVSKYINGSSATLFPDEDTNLSEAEQDMLAFIRLNNKNSMRTTVKMIVDTYEKKPYGWYFAAIVSILAKLYARDKVTFRSDSDLLEEKTLEKGLLNTQAHFNITLEPQIDFPASQLRASKDFIKDFFDEQPAATEAKALGKEMHSYFKHLADELRNFMTHHTHFPFLIRLEPLAEQVSGFLKKPHTFFLKEFDDHKEDLLDTKESLLDPLRNFMNGATKEDYQKIKMFCEMSKLNLQELRDGNYSELLTLLDSKDCFKGQCIKKMKTLYKGLKEAVDSALQKEKDNALQAVCRIKEQIIKEAEYTALSPEKQKRVNDRLVEIENDLLNLELIAAIRDKRHRFEQDGVTDLYNQMAAWGKEAKGESPKVSEGTPEPYGEYVSLQTLKVSFDKTVLATDEDIDAYLKKLKDLLQEAIKGSKKIKI